MPLYLTGDRFAICLNPEKGQQEHTNLTKTEMHLSAGNREHTVSDVPLCRAVDLRRKLRAHTAWRGTLVQPFISSRMCFFW